MQIVVCAMGTENLVSCRGTERGPLREGTSVCARRQHCQLAFVEAEARGGCSA